MPSLVRDPMPENGDGAIPLQIEIDASHRARCAFNTNMPCYNAKFDEFDEVSQQHYELEHNRLDELRDTMHMM